MSTTLDDVLRPATYIRGEPFYSAEDLNLVVAEDTLHGNYIERMEKKMSTNFDKASEIIEDARGRFNATLNKMLESETKASEAAKKVSGNVRKAADDLASGLLKVQKTADFNALERHVCLLERAAAALSTLAELDKAGKLESLVKAMK